jgi:hypothetical protein
MATDTATHIVGESAESMKNPPIMNAPLGTK